MLFDDRTRAESFGAVAELYDRARPSYPPELIDTLLEDAPRHVLDVGCGTGIASTLLAAGGADVLGIEVDARMAEVARTKGLAVEVSSFEQLGRPRSRVRSPHRRAVLALDRAPGGRREGRHGPAPRRPDRRLLELRRSTIRSAQPAR
jgi:predicted RNA methylase